MHPAADDDYRFMRADTRFHLELAQAVRDTSRALNLMLTTLGR